MNLLLAASDSDEEGDPASDMSVDRYRGEPNISIEDCPLKWWSGHAGPTQAWPLWHRNIWLHLQQWYCVKDCCQSLVTSCKRREQHCPLIMSPDWSVLATGSKKRNKRENLALRQFWISCLMSAVFFISLYYHWDIVYFTPCSTGELWGLHSSFETCYKYPTVAVYVLNCSVCHKRSTNFTPVLHITWLLLFQVRISMIVLLMVLFLFIFEVA